MIQMIKFKLMLVKIVYLQLKPLIIAILNSNLFTNILANDLILNIFIII